MAVYVALDQELRWLSYSRLVDQQSPTTWPFLYSAGAILNCTNSEQGSLIW
jgi:hypothetical protein